MNVANDPSPSISDLTYRQLRTDIIMGRARPGQKLRLDALKLSYKASVTTLREVLSRLSSEGFVVAESQRGFEVSPISVAELHEIAALRLLLEQNALTRSLSAGDVEWEGRIIAAHHRLSTHETALESSRGGDVDAWRQSDWAFHQALISACGSRVLMRTHSEVFDKYLRYQMIALAFRPGASRHEHGALLQAALRRDSTEACAVLSEHIRAGVEHALGIGTLKFQDW
jgi:DNA-binding GntR family transcriptional regulator